MTKEIPKPEKDEGDLTQAKAEGWGDVAQRQWQSIGQGALEGVITHGVNNYVQHPLNIVRDVGLGATFYAASIGPAWARSGVKIAGTLAGVSLIADIAKTGSELLPRLSEVANDPTSVERNKRWAQEKLGPLGFEFAVIGATGLALRPRGHAPLEPCPKPEEARLIRPATDGAGANQERLFGIVNKDTSEETARIKRFLSDTGSEFRSVERLKRGTHGAYLLEAPDGTQRVLKVIAQDHDCADHVRRTAAAAKTVDALPHRTPSYDRIEYTPGFGTWYIQEKLPGSPALYPSNNLVLQMMRMNEQQAGAAVSHRNNWSQRVMTAVHDDAHGWLNRIAASGPEGEALVRDIRSLISRDGFTPRTTDIVHGDFQHYNALVSKNDRLTGYIDWDGAGSGDRAIDLSRLLYDVYISEPALGYKASAGAISKLSNRIEEISGPQALNTYMSHWILQVTDFGMHYSPHDVPMMLNVGNRILRDLRSRRFAFDAPSSA